MKSAIKILSIAVIGVSLSSSMSSCVAKKKYVSLQNQLAKAEGDLVKCGDQVQDYKDRLATSEQSFQNSSQQANDLKAQIADFKNVRDKQLEQVGNLTVLSKSANDNIERTLSQLEKKDKYINLLQSARTKADSINLALAVNLKQVLRDGLDDTDVDIKVDKTVVMINLSDKMLFTSGSYKITSQANGVLSKIAQIIASRPELEVMVEGYTDNVAISNDCINDNWDLSSKRATAVVRALQRSFNVDPNKLIAAGRGEWNALTSNDTPAGRAINRRTRIILMPKLNQFYDLLNPDNAK